MKISITLNGEKRSFEIAPNETLFHLLRRSGIRSVKFGSEDGADGYSTVLVNGHPRAAIVTLAAQVEGADILTVEGLSGPQQRGWRGSAELHPIQRAFVETGAIQSGYDTPALVLLAKALLDRNPNPTEAEVRDWISGVLSRETGYTKPVQAILRAAAYLRGETPPPLEGGPGEMFVLPEDLLPPEEPVEPYEISGSGGAATRTLTTPKVVVTPQAEEFRVVGKPLPKVDALKL
ncbi:MAG TPA: 2Fe-2S iron-sulfur cluster-binding protein, partial [Anaerolineae bacterium]|nr:2Fe-2S iron-sulfur cluster-binding protein [Anaerolineae bacterium]